MRILHVIPQFPYFGGRTIIGGHASCLLTLALAQAEAGDEVTILSYADGRAGDIEIDGGVRLHSLFEDAAPGTAVYGLRFTRAATLWARARRDRFEVVHGHSGFADYFLTTRRLQAVTERPTLHTLYCPIPDAGGRWNRPGVRTLLRRWANRLDGLVAMSENVASSLRRYGLRDVQTVAPPVDTDRFAPPDDPAPARADLGLAPDDVAVLFVGNARPQKNLSGVLRAVSEIRPRHPNLKLVITTELKQSASDEQLDRLRNELVAFDLESCVIQRGIVPDMPRLMQACDLLVAPFLDSFGPSDYFMAALEAMACGRPVVVSATGGMPEVVSEETGRLVDPRSPHQIAAALETLVADAPARGAAGRAARTYTQQHFEPRRIVNRYRELYEGIIR